ncbi:GntR family transcriptional regulator [Bordetella bronchialis]|uniref:GntR family transcriptional regulator n=1 Tax=Bordetella bronchialis TaxID=463025 RepID=A0A193FIT4_9BORD|nr:GntR family transcriptional regulator [Bordetella bronchialis]ANN67019.1 GntR family transcriptional regulator [Bordetella bronchialis]ANN72095.1 GntR family transcriptional regulator [Bordetella bronchialis]
MEPRYAELTRTLVRDIAAGVYPVGGSLPSEIELASKYGVSRGTVRVALDRIQTLGLISRRKRAGTRVEAAEPRATEYGPTISTVEELVQYGADTRRVVHSLRTIVVDMALASRLGLPPGTRWIHIQTSRTNPHSPDYPLAWSHLYVPQEMGTRIRKSMEDQQALVCDLICQATGRVVKEIRQTVRAVGVPATLAETLGTEPGAHALEFVRQYYDQTGQLFEVAVSLHPADRFSYTTVLQRQGQGGR